VRGECISCSRGSVISKKRAQRGNKVFSNLEKWTTLWKRGDLWGCWAFVRWFEIWATRSEVVTRLLGTNFRYSRPLNQDIERNLTITTLTLKITTAIIFLCLSCWRDYTPKIYSKKNYHRWEDNRRSLWSFLVTMYAPLSPPLGSKSNCISSMPMRSLIVISHYVCWCWFCIGWAFVVVLQHRQRCSCSPRSFFSYYPAYPSQSQKPLHSEASMA